MAALMWVKWLASCFRLEENSSTASGRLDHPASFLFSCYGPLMKPTLQVVAFIGLFYFSSLATAQEPISPIGKRVVFLGDSITHAGGYVAVLEAALRLHDPVAKLEFLNLGLPSETVSGLSEPGHAGGAFPRPDLHERLTRVLEQTKPNLVVACYGMNDGIYYPLGNDRFESFKDGMERLHVAVEKSGAKIIHMTPAYFDALPIKDRLLPAGQDEYRQPYEGYDDVLSEYSKWLLSKKSSGWVVLDVHEAMKSAVMKQRETNPTFTFAGDGVHPNFDGQLVIAEPLAAYWGIDLSVIQKKGNGKAVLDLVSKKQNVQKLAWLSATKHVRPGIPAGVSLDEAAREAEVLDKNVEELAASK
jgi:lysophospholipase L1-like esterase